MWNLKIQCSWVHLIPSYKAVSFLFFYLRKDVAAGMRVVFWQFVCNLWSSPGWAWPGSCAAGSCREQDVITPGNLDARVDHYIKCQWSAKQGGHRDAYYLLALWKCESLFRLRAWPRGLIALIPIYKKSTNNSISSVTSVHSDENYNACISFTHSTKVGGF